MKGIHATLDIIRTDIRQKTETPHIDTEDGNLLLPHPTGGLQERTVATHRDYKIRIEVITREHLRGIRHDMLVVAQEIVIFLIDIHLGTNVSKRR